ncbi:DNA-directed RNA polymerase subunit omega [bacterium]|nr:DNA-directed RNA polymerase subunit omega [bacterium]
MVDDSLENGEELPPTRLLIRSRDLTNYYLLPLDDMITKAKDRYELVMKASRIAREINAARLRYGVPMPEKATVVSLNEILASKILEPRKPTDLLEPTEDLVE